jgi:site-specific DNA-methyltransferase (adenine-specific)
MIRNNCKELKLLIQKKKKYKIIYADPPWQHSSHRGSLKKARDNGIWGLADFDYNTMSLQNIKDYPVSEIAEEDSVLFLWATFPMIQQALEVMKSWGFSYRTVAFVWVKQNKGGTKIKPYGLGHYTLSNAEVVLLGRKGKFERKARNVQQILISPVTKHSEKPDEIKDRIVDLCGDVSRIELFARKKTKGWESNGDQLLVPQ